MRAKFATKSFYHVQVENSAGMVVLRPQTLTTALYKHEHRADLRFSADKPYCVLTCSFCGADVGSSLDKRFVDTPEALEHQGDLQRPWELIEHAAGCVAGPISLTPGEARAIASALMGAAADAKIAHDTEPKSLQPAHL